METPADVPLPAGACPSRLLHTGSKPLFQELRMGFPDFSPRHTAFTTTARPWSPQPPVCRMLRTKTEGFFPDGLIRSPSTSLRSQRDILTPAAQEVQHFPSPASPRDGRLLRIAHFTKSHKASRDLVGYPSTNIHRLPAFLKDKLVHGSVHILYGFVVFYESHRSKNTNPIQQLHHSQANGQGGQESAGSPVLAGSELRCRPPHPKGGSCNGEPRNGR